MQRAIAHQPVGERDEHALQQRLAAGDRAGGVFGLRAAGLPRIRLAFQALSPVRTKAWSRSTAMVTGVATGVPSRL